jgi:signal transduction histidine kinase
MLKAAIVILIFICCTKAWSQQIFDTNSIRILYDRCLDFDSQKADSLNFYANIITEKSAALNFTKGNIYANRLKGIYNEMYCNYEKAVKHYLLSLELARKLDIKLYESIALIDLAIIYADGLNRPDMARDFYKQALSVKVENRSVDNIMNNYVNLGAIFNQLHQPDSALKYLLTAKTIIEPYVNEVDVSSLNNNLGNVYFYKKQFSKALEYFKTNQQLHKANAVKDGLWVDKLNMADCFLELTLFDSAEIYAHESLEIALLLLSKTKQADSYALLSKLYKRKGDFEKAFAYQEKWISIDTSLVNRNTNETIARLQEQYHATEREKANKLLQVNIEKEKLRQRILFFIALAATLIGLLITYFLVVNTKAKRKLQEVNTLITKQHDKLTELNFEKNSLISIVSHDLSTPFASIKMWAQVLQQTSQHNIEEQQKAVGKILQSASKGELLIKNILDIEKAGTSHRKMHVETFDLEEHLQKIYDDFAPRAAAKNILLHYKKTGKPVLLISDKNFIERICENLLSNAIKYSPENKNIWMMLVEEEASVLIVIKDEGKGIPADELPALFSRYNKISTTPTGGEQSTGLGLSIAKRIAEELNATISCESTVGAGSTFTVMLKI